MMSVAKEEEILRRECISRHRTQSGSGIGVNDDGTLFPEPILNEEVLETSMEKACIEKEKEERRVIIAESSRKRRMREQSQAPKVKSPRLEALVKEDMEVEEQGSPPYEETRPDTEGLKLLNTLEILKMAMPDLDDAWQDTLLPDEDEHPSTSPIQKGRSLRERRQSEEEKKWKRSRSRSPNILSLARSSSPTRRSITPAVPNPHQLARDAFASVKSALDWLISLPSLDSSVLDLIGSLKRASTTLARIQKTVQLNVPKV